jgi:hypothetical protein
MAAIATDHRQNGAATCNLAVQMAIKIAVTRKTEKCIIPFSRSDMRSGASELASKETGVDCLIGFQKIPYGPLMITKKLVAVETF